MNGIDLGAVNYSEPTKITVIKPAIQAAGNIILVKKIVTKGTLSKIKGIDGKPLVETTDQKYYIVVSMGNEAMLNKPEIKLGFNLFTPCYHTHSEGGKQELVEVEMQMIYDRTAMQWYHLFDCLQIYAYEDLTSIVEFKDAE